MNSRKSISAIDKNPMVNTNGNYFFDACMGSIDSVEICELNYIYIVPMIHNRFKFLQGGLCDINGYLILRHMNKQ